MVVSLNLEWFAFSQHNFNSGIIHNSQSTTSFPFVNNPIVTCDILFLSSHSQIITILNDIVDRVLIWNWWTWETWNLVKKSTISKRSIASAHRWTKEKKTICTVIKFNVRFCISSPSQDTFSMWRQTTRIFNKMSVRSLNIYRNKKKNERKKKRKTYQIPYAYLSIEMFPILYLAVWPFSVCHSVDFATIG